MLDTLGTRQQQLLHLLLEHKSGLTVDELADALQITRTAVTQHLAVLERDGYVMKGNLQKTGGRPGRVYVLSPQGTHLFPKQYAWFANLLLGMLRKELGERGLVERLHGLAAELSSGLRARLAGKAPEDQVAEVVAIMNELAYEARALPGSDPERSGIEAKNCIYHDMARSYPEVCQFDIALLSQLLGSEVQHVECMVRGGNACRFLFGKPRP